MRYVKLLAPIVLLAIVGIKPLISQSWDECIESTLFHIQKGKYDKALVYAEKARKLSVQDNPKNYAISLDLIGQIYFWKGKLYKAEENLVTSKKLKEDLLIDNDSSYAQTLNNLSSVYQYIGKYKEAEKLLVRAKEIYLKQFGTNNLSYAKVLHNIAKLNQTLSRYSESEEAFIEALEIKKNITGENDPTYANTLLNLGSLYISLNNNSKAKEHIEEAVKIYRQSFGIVNSITINSEIQLAKLYLTLGMYKEVKSILQQIRQVENIIVSSNPEFTTSYYDLAMINYSLGYYKEAEELLKWTKTAIEKQFGKTSPQFFSCLNSLGIIEWILGDYEEAHKYLYQVVALRSLYYGELHPEYATSLHNLAGLLFVQKNYSQSEQYYHQAMKIYLSQIDTYFPFLSENERGKFYSQLKERFDLYNNFVLHRWPENPEILSQMYNYQLATKAVLLNSSLKVRNEIYNSKDDILIEKFAKWKSLKEKLAKLYHFSKSESETLKRNVDSIENQVNTLEKEISKKSLAFKKEYLKKDLTWKNIKNNLKKDEASVEILRFNLFVNGWTDKIYYVALIIKNSTPDNPEIVIMENSNELEGKYFTDYTNAINPPDSTTNDYSKFKSYLSSLPNRLNHLYQKYWSRIQEKLVGINKVYLSVDGIYNKINLNTLVADNGNNLVDNIDIHLVTSTRDLIERKFDKTEDSQQIAALFGNPNYDLDTTIAKQYASLFDEPIDSPFNYNLTRSSANKEWQPLKGTEDEVNDISRLLSSNKWETIVFVGDTATERAVKSVNNPKVLHIATHGFFDEDIELSGNTMMIEQKRTENPLLRSGLVFSGANKTIELVNEKNYDALLSMPEDGILTAYEVMNMNLDNTDLVVLSACETGLGEVRNGEGVYGLQRAFLVAGAKSLIMSLWEVDDNATRELMAEFYKSWMQTNNIRQSFRTAQRKLANSRKYSHPRYWGGFVILGD